MRVQLYAAIMQIFDMDIYFASITVNADFGMSDYNINLPGLGCLYKLRVPGLCHKGKKTLKSTSLIYMSGGKCNYTALIK